MINVLQTTQNKIIIKKIKLMKNKIINQILSLMAEHDVSVNEIVQAGNCQVYKDWHAFDLLCVSDGRLLRTSFLEGKELNPIAIFPFADNNIALFLRECQAEERCFVTEQDVPSIEYWKNIDGIKTELNQKLTELGAPIVDGVYFAEPRVGKRRANWIVCFQDGKVMHSCFYSLHEPAKFRACSPYYEKI